MKATIFRVKALIVLIIMISVSLLASMPVAWAAESTGFDDIPADAWYAKDVNTVRSLGIISGVGNNKFSPNSNISVAEYITVLVRLVKGEVTENKGNRWYDGYIQAAKDLGIIIGAEAENPERSITREDMMMFSCRALGIKPESNNTVIFSDTAGKDVSYINAAYNNYLTEGSGRDANGKIIFGYNGTGTRAQLAAMVLRVKDYKTDPATYMKAKQKERVLATLKYQEERDKYKYINGYKINRYSSINRTTEELGTLSPAGIRNEVDLSLSIYWHNIPEKIDYKSLEAELVEAQEIIASKFGDEIAKPVIDYARQRKDIMLKLDSKQVMQDFDMKFFKATDEFMIEVTSVARYNSIDVLVVEMDRMRDIVQSAKEGKLLNENYLKRIDEIQKLIP